MWRLCSPMTLKSRKKCSARIDFLRQKERPRWGSFFFGAGVLLRCPVCALPSKRLRCTPTAATRSGRCICPPGSAPLAPQTLTSGSSPTGTKINPIVNVSFTMGFIGAGGRTRTGTLSPAVDFESTTSTIPSHRQGVVQLLRCNRFFLLRCPISSLLLSNFVSYRPLPLARVAPPATGGASPAPHHTGKC